MSKQFSTSIKFLIVFFFLVGTSSITSYSQGQVAIAGMDSKQEAERIWELGIVAKGGREKLIGIRSVFVSTESTYYLGLKKITNRKETLYVLPNRWWIWDDHRPSVFGLEMTMYNLENGKKYYARQGEKDVQVDQLASNQKNTNLSGLVFDLMETKWNRPTPEAVIKGKVGSQDVDIVQTSLWGQRIDFYLDIKTHLPAKIIAYKDRIVNYQAEFSNYMEVDGIKMPSCFILGGNNGAAKTKYSIAYQFNVEYNESIFTTPPLPVESASEAWKKKK